MRTNRIQQLERLDHQYLGVPDNRLVIGHVVIKFRRCVSYDGLR